jgi:olefin beta-lactone synthetase
MAGPNRGAPLLPYGDQWRSWGVDPEWSHQRHIHSSGRFARWHYLDRTAEGEPEMTVVCVHGNPTWGVLWQPLLAGLPASWRVIAVDQLSMGFSERVESRRYDQRVEDLEAFINDLDITGPLAVVGHDWGGAITMGWAVRNPDAAAALVLVNTGIAVPEGRSAPSLIRLAAQRGVHDAATRRTKLFVRGTTTLSHGRIDRSMREALAAPYRRREHRVAVAEFVADVPFDESHPSSVNIASVAEAVSSLTTPTLLMWGAKDPVFDDSFAADLAARIPHADTHRVADAGHLLPVERPELFVESVTAFVTDAVTRKPAPGPSRSDRSSMSNRLIWANLSERAATDGDELAFFDGVAQSGVSFAELDRKVTAVAANLIAQGVRVGDRVAILVPPSVDMVAALYGCWKAGGVAVVADRGLGVRGLVGALRSAGPRWAVCTQRTAKAARLSRLVPGDRCLDVEDLASATSEVIDGFSSPVSMNHEAAVLFTSGATGPAKGVRYTHRQIAAQRDALMSLYAIAPDDRIVAAFAPFALYGPAFGVTSAIPDVDVTTPGDLTTEALSEVCQKVEATVVFAAPAALRNVVGTYRGETEGFAQVRLVLSAGAPVSSALLGEVAKLFPHAALRTPYGMTEHLPVADIDLNEIRRAEADCSRMGTPPGVCVGKPADKCDVRVVPYSDGSVRPDTVLAAGQTGEIIVRSPWMSSGYDRRWAVNHHARPVGRYRRVWHRTGDVGHFDDEGRLWVEGRSAHLVHTEKGPITPVPVERAVERLGFGGAAAVAVGPRGSQRLVVVIEDTHRPEGLTRDGITTAVRSAVSSAVGTAPVAVLAIKKLPVDIRHNSKIDRTALGRWAEVLLAGGSKRAARRALRG